MSEENKKNPAVEEQQNPEAEVVTEAQEEKAPAAEAAVEDEKNTIVEEADEVFEEIPAVLPEDEDEDDWWKEIEEYSPKQRAEMEKMYSSTLKEFEENEIVEGTVGNIGEKEVVMNIGFKSEGVIPISEFRDTPDLGVGDKVEVFIEKIEDANGQLLLSRKRAKRLRSWERIEASMEKDTILNGHIMRRTKGGFVVDIDGIEAFLPGSQIDVKPVRDFDAYVGKDMEFKAVKINQAYENVVVSHKILIEAKLEEQRKEILANLEKGQILEGMVKNMTNFGVFIDLGGVDGLLHITDISWGRINHPEEVLELDEKVNVVVLDFDDAKKRISLGMKQLTPHPWDSLPEEIQEGSTVKGKVVTVADYGIFLEILPGVEGLVHTSEMSWSQHVKNPNETFNTGDELEAVVLNIDREERKMSLGLKQLQEDPWDKVPEKYAVGSTHTGIVRNMTNYGLFLELEEGVDGLVHISDLSWTKKFNHPNEFINTGEELEVVVLELDVENRRLSLGHKQLTEDVWDTFASIFTLGSRHKGTIKRIDNRGGATVELEYGVEGQVPPKHMKTEEGKDALKAEEVAEFEVIEFNKDAKRLVLSHTKIWEPEIEVPKKKTSKKSGGKKSSKADAKAGTTTLGDLDALQKLKEQMEATEKDTKKKPTAKKKATEEEVKETEAKVEKEAPATEKKDAEPEKEVEAKEEKPAAKKKASEEEAKEAETKEEKEAPATDKKEAEEKEAEAKEEKPAAKKKASTAKKTTAKAKKEEAGEEAEEKPKKSKTSKAKKTAKAKKEEKGEAEEEEKDDK